MSEVAKKQYETVEEVAQAMGVEVTEATLPFLKKFVKTTLKPSGQKKKELLDVAAAYGLEGLDADKETVDSLKIRIIQYLHDEGRFEERDEFSAKQHLVASEDDDSGEVRVFRAKAPVKDIADRNSGVKEGTVGYNTIQLLKDAELADKTPAELAEIMQERFEQKTTAASISWYINYCRQKVSKLKEAGQDTSAFEICDRKRAARATKTEGGVALGKEMTLADALKPRGFGKKKAEGGLGEEMTVEGDEQ